MHAVVVQVDNPNSPRRGVAANASVRSLHLPPALCQEAARDVEVEKETVLCWAWQVGKARERPFGQAVWVPRCHTWQSRYVAALLSRHCRLAIQRCCCFWGVKVWSAHVMNACRGKVNALNASSVPSRGQSRFFRPMCALPCLWRGVRSTLPRS